MNRTTLTKSLHTVTAVTRVALYLNAKRPDAYFAETLTRDALEVLGQSSELFNASDATFAACVASVRKAIGRA